MSTIRRNTRSKSLLQRKEWISYTSTVIENLVTHNFIIDDYNVRKTIWVEAIKYLLQECDTQNIAENKAIIVIQIYRILVHLLEYHYMDFEKIKKFWTTIENKSTELLLQLENKKRNLSKDTYTKAKNIIHLVQQYQILYKDKLFNNNESSSNKRRRMM